MSDTSISLPKFPKDKDYEDYISAQLQAGGFYIERNIIYREEAEIMELDIFSTDFDKESTNKKLIEIKSGGWGFSDIFKIKGWMVYLDVKEGAFIVQKPDDHFDYFQQKSLELDVDLIDNFEGSLDALYKKFDIAPSKKIVASIRYAYFLERKMLKQIKQLKKESPQVVGYRKLDSYFFDINSNSFFTAKPVDRIKELFKLYIDNKNISAKICNELETGNYDDDVSCLSDECYSKLFYKAELSPIHISLYVEHLTRLTILKSCTEHLIDICNGNYDKQSLDGFLDYLDLPQNIKDGLISIVHDEYFHRYPIFWQMYTYVFGGFILADFEEDEYKLLSTLAGIPVDEIPKAFKAFDILFPTESGWQTDLKYSKIKWHKMFSLPFCGIGANLRCYLYCDDGDNAFDKLGRKLTGMHTLDDLIKWNNLGYNYLSL